MTTDRPELVSNFDKYFTPIAVELGRLVYAWNELHEELGHIYEMVLQPKQLGAALASWRAVESDRTQRTMLEYATRAVRWDKTESRPSTREDILWLLEKVGKLAEQRNNAIHSPFAVLTDQKAGTTGIVPLDFFGHPRAQRLSNTQNALLKEINFYFRRAKALFNYAMTINFCLGLESAAWPDRPQLPER